MGLSLRGQTSGAVDINAPDVAGDNTITLPGGNGSANQFYKNSDTAGIVTHSSMTENSSGVISIGDIDINGTTRTITTGVGQTVGFSTDIEVQGSVSISSGNLVLASGSGIDFSATADGSGTMTSELLDDYEEGTFTPVLEGSTTAGTYTYGAQVGMYTKIGRVVNSTLVLTDITVSSAGSGSLVITGFPFVSSSTTSINFNGAARTDSLTFGSSTNYVVPTMSGNQSGINLQNIKDGLPDTSVNVTSSIASGQTDIFINITYMVD